MLKHLRDQARQAPVMRPPAATLPPYRPPQPRGVSWRTIGFTLAAIFGLYVFGGHFVLPKEVQWPTVSGQIFGLREAEHINATIPAKAAEAFAVASATETGKVEPAARLYAENKKEDAKLYARNKREDVRAAQDISDVTVVTAGRVASIDAAKAAQVAAAQAYQTCVANARQAAMTAQAAAQSRPNATQAEIDVAGQIARERGREICEPLLPQEASARAAAVAAARDVFGGGR